MSFWKKMLGVDPPPEPISTEATARDRTQAECHRDRFARAIVQARVALARGETTAARLAELERWHGYYDGLAKLEAAVAAPVEEAG